MDRESVVRPYPHVHDALLYALRNAAGLPDDD